MAGHSRQALPSGWLRASQILGFQSNLPESQILESGNTESHTRRWAERLPPEIGIRECTQAQQVQVQFTRLSLESVESKTGSPLSQRLTSGRICIGRAGVLCRWCGIGGASLRKEGLVNCWQHQLAELSGRVLIGCVL